MKKLFESIVNVFANAIIIALDKKPLLIPTNYGDYAKELSLFEKVSECDLSNARYYASRIIDDSKILFVTGTKNLSKERQQYDIVNCNDKDVFIVVMDNFIMNDINYLFRHFTNIIRCFLINNHSIKINNTSKAKFLSIAPEVLAIKSLCESYMDYRKLENVDKDYAKLIATSSISELFVEGKILTYIKQTNIKSK